MAVTERLEMLLTANGSQAIAEFQKTGAAAQKSLGQADNATSRLGTNLVRAGAGMAALGGVMLVGLYKAAQAAEEEGLAVDRLNNSIAQSPELAGASTDAFLDQAAALQDVTTFADDATIAAQAMLGTFHLTQDEILGLTPLVADLAAKFDLDLTRAALLVGKAMDGNSGALGRMGVRIDQNAFAADRYSAVMEALRENAGGFAEQEGARLSGRVEILKNNLGDLAEGVGVGAVDAFGTLLSPIEAVSDGLGDISPDAQAAAGQVLTFSAAGLVAAGSASMLAGGIINAAQRFGQLKEMLAASSIAGAGPIFLGVAGAIGIGAAAAAAFGSAQQNAIGDVDALSAAVQEQNGLIGQNTEEWLANTLMQGEGDLGTLRDAMADVGLTVSDLNSALVNGGDEADRFLERLLGSSEGADRLARATEQTGRAANTARTGFGAYGSELGSVLEGLGMSFDQVVDDQQTHNELLGDGAVSAEELADAYDNLTSKIDEYLSRLMGSEEAAAAEAEAQQAWQQSLLENGRTYDLNTEAGRENVRSRNAWIESVAGQIQAAAEYGSITGNTEAAQRRMNGAVRSAVGDLRRARDAGLITAEQYDTLRRRIERIPRRVPLAVGPIEGFDGTMDQLQAIYDEAQRAATAVGQIGGSLAGGGTYQPEAASNESGGRSRTAERAATETGSRGRTRGGPQHVIVIGGVA